MQEPLFFDDLNDAMRHLVQVLGGYKNVGHALWPTLGVEPAATKLRNCTNAGRAERLAPEDLITLMRMGREVGCHAVASYVGEAMGYALTPVSPADELEALQRAWIESVKAQRQIAERMERLQGLERPVVKVS